MSRRYHILNHRIQHSHPYLCEYGDDNLQDVLRDQILNSILLRLGLENGEQARDEMDLVIVSIRGKHYKITVLVDRYCGRSGYYVQEIGEPIFVEDVSKMKKMSEKDMINLMNYITGSLYNGENDYDALYFCDPEDIDCPYPGDKIVGTIIDNLKATL